MAHKKGQGSVKNGRDSVSKRLGVKKFGSELVVAGNIIVRPAGGEVVVDWGIGETLRHGVLAESEPDFWLGISCNRCSDFSFVL